MILVSGRLLAATVRNVTVLSVSEDKDRLGSTLRLELEGNTLTMTTTDRYRLIVARVPVVNESGESWAVNVDALAFNDSCKGAAKVREVNVYCEPGNDTPIVIDHHSIPPRYVAKGAINDDRYPDTVHIDRKFEGELIPLTTYKLSVDMLRVLGKLKFDDKGVELQARTVATRRGDIDMGMIEYTTVNCPVDYRIVTMTRTPK